MQPQIERTRERERELLRERERERESIAARGLERDTMRNMRLSAGVLVGAAAAVELGRARPLRAELVRRRQLSGSHSEGLRSPKKAEPIS
eukprot:15485788-Alexandrium_andersonii.AAC.1